jgi:predicted RNA-binding Zn-ribbon protein involved in translation (DUF1610 family)
MRGRAVSTNNAEAAMDNIRSQPCPDCGLTMMWTHNAWQTDSSAESAYRCENGHVLDPALTKQCPACGVHDTVLLSESEGRQQFRCDGCGKTFEFPR